MAANSVDGALIFPLKAKLEIQSVGGLGILISLSCVLGCTGAAVAEPSGVCFLLKEANDIVPNGNKGDKYVTKEKSKQNQKQKKQNSNTDTTRPFRNETRRQRLLLRRRLVLVQLPPPMITIDNITPHYE